MIDNTIAALLVQAGAPPAASVAALHDRPRSVVSRIQLTESWHGCERIIAKQVIGDSGRFNRELAALRLLSSCKIDPPVAPQLLAWDACSRLLFIEDLGDHSLANVLLGHDQSAAHTTLQAYAAALGRMHAATAGNPRSGGRLNAPDNLRDLQRHGTNFREFCNAAGVAVDAAFDTDVTQTETGLNSPGPFCALTHGDPCPDNERLTAHGIVFIDFETGRFDHALLDAAYFIMAFPTCWCVGSYPSGILVKMLTEYRRALGSRVPEAADDAVFFHHLLHASARWLLDGGTLLQRADRDGSNHLLGILESDWQWGPATARQRLLHRLQSFVQLAENTGDLHGIATTAGRLHLNLVSRWPRSEWQLAAYPAFREH